MNLSMNRYTNRFYRPVGNRSPGNNNFVRWGGEKANQYSQLVAQIGVLPLGSTNIEPLFVEAMQLFLEEQVVIPLNQAIMLIIFELISDLQLDPEASSGLTARLCVISA